MGKNHSSAKVVFEKASKHSFRWQIVLNDQVICRGRLSRPVGQVKHWTLYCAQLSDTPVQVVGGGLTTDFIQSEARKAILRLLKKRANLYIKLRQLIER